MLCTKNIKTHSISVNNSFKEQISQYDFSFPNEPFTQPIIIIRNDLSNTMVSYPKLKKSNKLITSV